MAKPSAQEQLMKLMSKTAPASALKPAAPTKKTFSFRGIVFSINTLNQIFLVGIILCIIGLVLEMRSGISLLKQNVDLTDDSQSKPSTTEAVLPATKSLKYYLDNVKSRNIFKPYQPMHAKSTPGQVDVSQRLSKFKLVGVSWLDLPETASVMIEDTQSHVTYFLKQGEQLEGVTVKTIYTDRAVFSYENEEITIKL